LHLRPSTSVAEAAQAHYQTIPSLLRLLLNTFGAQSQSGDLLSFLLFEKEFTRTLIDMGYHDTLACAATVKAFFN
jgi:NTE family protein